MEILNILVGILLLLLGRRLFWLFVGAMGFIAGLNLATQYLSGQPDWVLMVVALIAGLVGALLAVLFQRIAVAVAGFFAGGYLVIALLSAIQLDVEPFSQILYVIGGLIGAILVFVLFDWALIVLSSLVGASLIVSSVSLTSAGEAIVFIVLLIIGFFAQAGLLRRAGPPPPARPRRVRRVRRSA